MLVRLDLFIHSNLFVYLSSCFHFWNSVLSTFENSPSWSDLQNGSAFTNAFLFELKQGHMYLLESVLSMECFWKNQLSFWCLIFLRMLALLEKLSSWKYNKVKTCVSKFMGDSMIILFLVNKNITFVMPWGHIVHGAVNTMC